MLKATLSTFAVLTLLTTAQVATAQETQKRERPLTAEQAQVEAKKRASNAWFYGGIAAATGVMSGAVALAEGKGCDDMPEDTEAQLGSKAECHREAGTIAAYGLGIGLATFVGTYVVSRVVAPSREEELRAARRTKPVRLGLAGDPKQKSVRAAVSFVF
ncbi:MAG: hypothetical protein IT377_20540 [Polyangiaceae bacterium]|nr:hypothetical protein [Polyangiaceae bacterium]